MKQMRVMGFVVSMVIVVSAQVLEKITPARARSWVYFDGSSRGSFRNSMRNQTRFWFTHQKIAQSLRFSLKPCGLRLLSGSTTLSVELLERLLRRRERIHILASATDQSLF